MDEAAILELAQTIIGSYEASVLNNTSLTTDSDALNCFITDTSSANIGATVLWLIVFYFNRPGFIIALSPYPLSSCLLDKAPAGRPSVLWYIANQQPDILVQLAKPSTIPGFPNEFLNYIKTLNLNAAYNNISIFHSLVTAPLGRAFIMRCPVLLFKAQFNDDQLQAIKQNWQISNFPELEIFLKLFILVGIDLPTDIVNNDFDNYYLQRKDNLNDQVNTWLQQPELNTTPLHLAPTSPQSQLLLQQITSDNPDLNFLDTKFTTILMQKRLIAMQQFNQSLDGIMGDFGSLNVGQPQQANQQPNPDIEDLLGKLNLN